MYPFALSISDGFIDSVDLWNLDEHSQFRVCKQKNGILSIFFESTDAGDTESATFLDMKAVVEKSHDVLQSFFLRDYVSEKEKRRRLFQLFALDLLSGFSGQVLEAACDRDVAADIVPPLITTADRRQALLLQVAGGTALVVTVAAMLFYLFLFSVQQSATNQRDWWHSLFMWIVMDVLLLSTANVFFTYYVLPAFTMKDVRVVEQKLRECVRQCQIKSQMRHDHHEHHDDAQDDDAVEAAKPFDSSEYFFVSKRVARQFPQWPESEWVLSFSTPWPRRSYTHVVDVSSDYSGSMFVTLLSFVSAVGMFVFSTYVQMPSSVQDLVTELATVSGIGYVCVAVLRLFLISPALLTVPILLLLVVVAGFLVDTNRSTPEHVDHQRHHADHDIESAAPHEHVEVALGDDRSRDEVENDPLEGAEDVVPSPMNSDYFNVSSESSSLSQNHNADSIVHHIGPAYEESDLDDDSGEYDNDSDVDSDDEEDWNSDIFSISSDEPSEHESHSSDSVY